MKQFVALFLSLLLLAGCGAPAKPPPPAPGGRFRSRRGSAGSGERRARALRARGAAARKRVDRLAGGRDRRADSGAGAAARGGDPRGLPLAHRKRLLRRPGGPRRVAVPRRPGRAAPLPRKPRPQPAALRRRLLRGLCRRNGRAAAADGLQGAICVGAHDLGRGGIRRPRVDRRTARREMVPPRPAARTERRQIGTGELPVLPSGRPDDARRPPLGRIPRGLLRGRDRARTAGNHPHRAGRPRLPRGVCPHPRAR